MKFIFLKKTFPVNPNWFRNNFYIPYTPSILCQCVYFQYVLNVSLFSHSIDIYEHSLHAEGIAMNKIDMVPCLHKLDVLVGEMTQK